MRTSATTRQYKYAQQENLIKRGRLRAVLAVALCAGALIVPANIAQAEPAAAVSAASAVLAKGPKPSTTSIMAPGGQLKVLPAISAVTVKVAGASTNKTGAVVVKEGGKTIGYGVVNSAGQGVIQLDASLRAGDHLLTANYSGNALTMSSKSDASLVRVTFTDVTGGLFFEPIQFMASYKITTGFDAAGTIFNPSAGLDRQAMAAWLYRLMHNGEKAQLCIAKPANDVEKNNPFCGEIAWMYFANLTTGYQENGVNNFHPGELVQRDQAVAFIFRLFGQNTGPCPGAQPFIDVPSTNPLCNAIAFAVNNGITQGFPDGKFHPTAKAERQAIAAFFYRLD